MKLKYESEVVPGNSIIVSNITNVSAYRSPYVFWKFSFIVSLISSKDDYLLSKGFFLDSLIEL